ncbi:hypothetical protein F6X00_15950 [Vibrio vulnificus]|nr:hypothetical protein F6X00_15950 [Vibrio vulnificus]HAS8400178.1 hypothetical protein [Vibrio vulnificus]
MNDNSIRQIKQKVDAFTSTFLYCLEPRTSNLEPRTSNLEPRTSNLEPITYVLAYRYQVETDLA